MVNLPTDTAPTTAPPRDLPVAAAPHGARSPTGHRAARALVLADPPAAVRSGWVFRWRGAPVSRPWRYALPSLVTALGLVAGLAGAALLPSLGGALLLVVSLLLDGCDGAIARRLGASTALGGAFDLSSDHVIAVAVAWATWPRPVAAGLSAALAVLVTVAPSVAPLRRVSGRVPVCAAALAWCWHSGAWSAAATPGELAALGLVAAALGAGVLRARRS